MIDPVAFTRRKIEQLKAERDADPGGAREAHLDREIAAWRALLAELLTVPSPKPVQGGTLTAEQLVEACRNIGYDLTCGGCAELFYTGARLNPHDGHCAWWCVQSAPTKTFTQLKSRLSDAGINAGVAAEPPDPAQAFVKAVEQKQVDEAMRFQELRERIAVSAVAGHADHTPADTESIAACAYALGDALGRLLVYGPEEPEGETNG